MPAARAASSRLIPSRALASASRRPLTRPSRSRRAIARSSAGVRPVAIATATMAQVPGLLSLPGQLAGRRPRSRLLVAGIKHPLATLPGGKEAGMHRLHIRFPAHVPLPTFKSNDLLHDAIVTGLHAAGVPLERLGGPGAAAPPLPPRPLPL